MKKALFLTTISGFLQQFEMNDVEILQEMGFEVHYASNFYNPVYEVDKSELRSKGIVLHQVGIQKSPIQLFKNLKAFWQVRKILIKENIDIIHCHNPMGGVIGRLAALGLKKKLTVIYTAHGFHFYDGAPKKNWIVYYPIEKFFSRMTDTLITICDEDYKLAKDKFHCNVEHIHSVGANSAKFYEMDDEVRAELRQKLGYGEDELIILNVGELLPNKNQKSAIRAMQTITKEIPNSRLLIAGNGPERESLLALIQELGLEQYVELLGYTTHLEEYTNICDALVACSYREGLPMNLIEAMLCGKPVVASVNRGHRELVRDGYNGFLVSPDDVDDYAQKLIKVLKNSSDYRSNALELSQVYTDNNVKDELKTIYNIGEKLL